MVRLLVFFAIFLLVGCNKPLLTPEENDPIYKELVGQLGVAEKDVVDREKAVEEAFAQLAKIAPQTGESGRFYGQYFDAKKGLDKAKQQLEYYKLRVNSRKFAARQEYLEAFKAGAPWPDPKQFESYNVNKKLASIDRNWRHRYPAATPAKGKEEKKGKGEGKGGGHSSE